MQSYLAYKTFPEGREILAGRRLLLPEYVGRVEKWGSWAEACDPGPAEQIGSRDQRERPEHSYNTQKHRAHSQGSQITAPANARRQGHPVLAQYLAELRLPLIQTTISPRYIKRPPHMHILFQRQWEEATCRTEGSEAQKISTASLENYFRVLREALTDTPIQRVCRKIAERFIQETLTSRENQLLA